MQNIYDLQKQSEELFQDFENYTFYFSNPEELYTPIQYSLCQGGKRLRPLLSLMACTFFDGDLNEVKNPAIGLEIFHNFTLLHDDIMDQSPLRRGALSVYKKWNTNTAILSGDTMFVIAYEYITKTNPEILLETLQLFNTTAKQVCEGQQYDMNFESKKNVIIDDYMNMICLKTAVLIAAALKTGAIAARATKEDADKIYDFGILIGLAFQLKDDFLDAFGSVSIFGKPIGNDIVTNKKTYLYLKAYELADDKTKKELDLSFNLEDKKTKVERVLSIYKNLNIAQITENKIMELHDKAMDILKSLTEDENKIKLFTDILTNLIKRQV